MGHSTQCCLLFAQQGAMGQQFVNVQLHGIWWTPGMPVGVLLGHEARNDVGIKPVSLAPRAQRLSVAIHVVGIEHVDNVAGL